MMLCKVSVGGTASGTTPFCQFSQRLKRCSIFLALLLVTGIGEISAWGYSLLTHEQVVDILWKDAIEPLLLRRFPGASSNDLRVAHAHAYGGCLIQDIGYYPFGNQFFSDLTHYVRSGDFVENLLRESTNINEYAFALGALAHYCSDSIGHPIINRVVALSFPKLKKKYGEEVTFAEDPKAHIRVEFGFDMTQVAKNRYTSDKYRDFIGFQVSKPVLERAFYKTYGLKLDEVIPHVDLAISTFRRAVSQVLPEMTRVALATRKPELVKETSNFNQKEFRFNLSRSEYEKEWGKDYQKPGWLARFVALFVRWIPKVGPCKALAFKIPTPETEDMYVGSVNRTVDIYRSMLREVSSSQVDLPNIDFDTGRPPVAGEYVLSDKTYARLLDELSHRSLERVKPDLLKDILTFYSEPVEPTKKDQKAWARTQRQLRNLKGYASAK